MGGIEYCTLRGLYNSPDNPLNTTVNIGYGAYVRFLETTSFMSFSHKVIGRFVILLFNFFGKFHTKVFYETRMR